MAASGTPTLPPEITQFLGDIPTLSRTELRQRLYPVAHLLFLNPRLAPEIAQLVLTQIKDTKLDFGSFAEDGRVGKPLRELAAIEDPDSHTIRAKARELVRLALPREPVRERVTGESRTEQYELLGLGQPHRRTPTGPRLSFKYEINPENIVEIVLNKKSVTAIFAIMRGGIFTENDERVIREIHEVIVPAEHETVPYWLQDTWQEFREELRLVIERIDNHELPLEAFGEEQTRKSKLIFAARDLLNEMQIDITTGGRLKVTPAIQDSDTVSL